MSKSSVSIRIGLFILGINVAFLPPAGFAEMYKWTDEDGVVHYTQHPPPEEFEVTEIDPPPDIDTKKALNEFEAEQEKLHELEKQREEQEAKQAEKERIAAIFEKNCQISRDRLKKLQNTGRVRAIDAEGNMTRITPEEHQSRIDAVKKKIEKYCK